ncbi:uncharacterized protein LOC126810100 isoform X1 [Patella vulgata]|uniref:uncharacterized protein LOC126810100 isoform X1 n=1 Tax=Patella vulgata TaxID=6465 RepID=UPI00218034FC|nr:uncharacterized protein LOC126810100 isoform X1 [Patella vulgata]
MSHENGLLISNLQTSNSVAKNGLLDSSSRGRTNLSENINNMEQTLLPVMAEQHTDSINRHLPDLVSSEDTSDVLSPVSSEESKTIKEMSRLSQSLSVDQDEFDPQSFEAACESDRQASAFHDSNSMGESETLVDLSNFQITDELSPESNPNGRSRPNSLSLHDPQEIMQSEAVNGTMNNTHSKKTIEKKKLSNSRSRTQSDVIIIPPTRQILAEIEAQESLSKSLPQGTILRKGDMIEFIADDLQEKIRRSSPMSKTGSSNSRRSSVRSTASYSSNTSACTSMATSTASGWSRSPSSLFQQSPDDIPPIDPNAIVELENQARRVADDVDLMLGNLRSSLHKMSARSVACLTAYKDSVDYTCDSVDTSIKSMYALMAKCEELSKTVDPIYQLANEIKEIKRLLDLFESQLTEKASKTTN